MISTGMQVMKTFHRCRTNLTCCHRWICMILEIIFVQNPQQSHSGLQKFQRRRQELFILVSKAHHQGWFQLISVPPPPPYGRTTHQVKGPGFFMITCVRKIRILLLKVEECPDFSILQSNYPYVAPMEELASTLKVWIFPNFCHFPWIFASRQRNAPGFSGIFAYIRIFSSIGGGTDINWNHPKEKSSPSCHRTQQAKFYCGMPEYFKKATGS